LAKEINDAGGKALFVKLNVTDPNQWADAVKRIQEQFGALHILMNIVGSNALQMIPDVDLAAWNQMFETNVTSILVGIQTCAPLMRASGGGSIINIGSVAGITGNFSTAYSSSKWALEGLSRSAAYLLADWGIRCNMIQPGFIETDMTAPMAANPLFKLISKGTFNNTVLLRRVGKAEEIASAALFLASDESSYMTGTDIVVDGGWVTTAPYLINARRNHMLTLLKRRGAVEKFLNRFR
jgi:NAD(P)-dependent dehydrogenase (short-subunit alcohol dehydrogenase family)